MATLVKNLKLSDQVYKVGDLPKVYIPKGSITVAQANAGISGIEVGWVYNLLDEGTITNGTSGESFTVVRGDNICWVDDGTTSSPVYCWDKIGSSAVQYEGTDPIEVDNSTRKISVKTASTTQLGAVKVGTNIDVDASGVISVATGGTDLGVVKAGTNVTITDGAVSVATGSETEKGIVTSSTNTAITDGALAVSLDKAATAEGKTVYDDATLGDLFRLLGGTVEGPSGFYVNGGSTSYATITEAIAAASATSGTIQIAAYDDFTLTGDEDWSSLRGRSVRLYGGKGTKSVTITFTGTDKWIVLNHVNAMMSQFTLANFTVNCTTTTGAVYVGDITLENVDLNTNSSAGVYVKSNEDSSSHGYINLTNVNIDGNGVAKYALSTDEGSTNGDVFTGCTFTGFFRSAVGFNNHDSNVTFTNCTFDGSDVNKNENVALVNFQGGTGGGSGNPTFTGCTFTNFTWETGGETYAGPAVADRLVDGDTQGTMTFTNCTFDDSIKYLVAFGDARAGGVSTHLHFTIAGDGNTWTDWDETTQTGTKLTLKEGTSDRYTGVGYLGANPPVEVAWAGTQGYTGDVGSIGRAA